MSYLMFNIFLFLLIGLSILALYLIYKVEDLEKELKEKHSLVYSSRKFLADAESRISQRNKIIEYQEEVNKKLQSELIMLKTHITSNNYGSTEIQIRKLKELVNELDKAN